MGLHQITFELHKYFRLNQMDEKPEIVKSFLLTFPLCSG